MLFQQLSQICEFSQKLGADLLPRGEVCKFFLVDLFLHEDIKHQMLIDLSLLVIGGFGQGGPCFSKQFFPPAHFFDACIIDIDSSVKSLNHPLPGLFVFPLDHLIDFFELILNLPEDQIILIIKRFLIFSHLHINIFDSLQLLVQNSEVIFVILGDVTH